MSDYSPNPPHPSVQSHWQQQPPSATDQPRFVARPPGSEASEWGTSSDSGVRLGRSGETLSEFGPLGRLVADPLVTDVFVNGHDEVWFDRGGGLESEHFPELDERHLRELAVRLIAQGGRHIDETSPCVDVRLHDGIRVHAVLPPISPRGTLLSIRLPRVGHLSLGDLDAAQFFAVVPPATVSRLVERRANVLISGAGGSGKTTLLSAILSSAPSTDRIVAIEDVAELRVAHPQFVSLEARQANLEGAGEVGLQRLVREALRMRPDRLVLGECRGAEIRELLAALNTGHDGGAGTLHANSLADVPARLEALGALAEMSPTAVARQTVSAIDAVLHLRRDHGVRRLVEVGSFVLDANGRLQVRPAEPGHPLDDQP
ncbi:TadA family conjugal transfer-associated ATPase [Homoserinimonas sp. A447]